MTRQIFSPSRMVGAVALLATLTCLLAFAPRQMAVAQSVAIQSPAVVPQNSSAQASPSVSFLPAVAYASGLHGLSVAVADVNEDGFPDLLVAHGQNTMIPGYGSVGVLLGNGDGTFQTSVNYSTGGNGTGSVASADVNGDGHLDLVVTNSCQGSDCSHDGSVGVLLGNGDGTFQPSVIYSAGGPAPTSIRIADVNEDGHPDVVVSNFCSNQPCPGYTSSNSRMSVLLGNGDGTFQVAVNYDSGGAYTNSLEVADVNGDHHVDVVAGSYCIPSTCGGPNYKGTLGVLLGNGDGTFRAAVIYNLNSIPISVVIGDINGDSRPDLVVGGCPSSCTQGIVSVLIGKGDGTFGPPLRYNAASFQVTSVAIGDLNGDQHPDLALASECRSSSDCNPGVVSVLVGNGDGTFQAPTTYSSGGIISLSVTIADLNADGRPDLAVANDEDFSYIAGSVGVLLNNTRVDTAPPVITLSASPKILWPPNGSMVPVVISGKITDSGSGVVVGSTEYAVFDEYHLVQPAGHFTVDGAGNYYFTVLLQASCHGSDPDGRRYDIRVRARDNTGNGATKWGSVIVPHDRR